jgi:hypothetical protein
MSMVLVHLHVHVLVGHPCPGPCSCCTSICSCTGYMYLCLYIQTYINIYIYTYVPTYVADAQLWGGTPRTPLCWKAHLMHPVMTACSCKVCSKDVENDAAANFRPICCEFRMMLWLSGWGMLSMGQGVVQIQSRLVKGWGFFKISWGKWERLREAWFLVSQN